MAFNAHGSYTPFASNPIQGEYTRNVTIGHAQQIPKMEVKFAAQAANFADLIAALRLPLGGLGGRSPPSLNAGVWGVPAPQCEEKCLGFRVRVKKIP